MLFYIHLFADDAAFPHKLPFNDSIQGRWIRPEVVDPTYTGPDTVSTALWGFELTDREVIEFVRGMKGALTVYVGGWPDDVRPKTHQAYFRFDDHVDAVHYKLRWG